MKHAALILFMILNASSQASTLSSTLDIVSESLYLHGADIEHLRQRLPGFIDAEFHYVIGCKTAPFNSLNDVECAMGLRAFARALYRGRLSEGSRWKNVLRITVVDGPYRTEITDGTLNVYIPYKIEDVNLEILFEKTLSDPSLAMLQNQYERLQALWLDIESDLPVKVDHGPALSTPEQFNAIIKIKAVLDESADFFDPKYEVLHVGYSFQTIHENNMQSQLGIDARASLSEITKFLKREARPAVSEERTLGAIQYLRTQVQKLAPMLIDSFNARLDCRSDDGLKLAQCFKAMNKIYAFLNANKKVSLPPILVVAQGTLSSCCYVAESGDLRASQIVLRADFSPQDLKLFLTNKGWLE